jgi:uroporphyrinogen decarboxylase
LGGNIFERPHYLRGMDNFFMDLMINPDIAVALMDKVLEIEMDVDRLIYNEIGEFLSYTRFRGEDMGTQNNLLISSKVFRDLIKPRLQKEWRAAKALFTSKNPKGKIAVHSCGAIYSIIPDFIEMGADILNPVQSNAQGMDTALINKSFGDRLSFHGSVDSQDVLNNGSVDDVIKETKTRLKDLAPGGGFIIAPSHNIQHSVSVEKIIAMYETIHEFGKYPINIQ